MIGSGQAVLQKIFKDKFNNTIKCWFYNDQETEDHKGYYENTGILASLFDLYFNNNEENINEPIIKIQGINQMQTFIKDLEEISQSIDQNNNRDVIYIRRRPVEKGQENHWVVFYFFKDQTKRKNLLFIDTQNSSISQCSNFREEIDNFLRAQNCNLYVSTTKIQKDNYSCGPIASEIARMLYNNNESVKEDLFQYKEQDVALETLPSLKDEFSKLQSAFSTKGDVNYGDGDKKLYGADIRKADFEGALVIGEEDINNQVISPDKPLNTTDLEGFKKARSKYRLEPSSDLGYHSNSSSSSDLSVSQSESNCPQKDHGDSSAQNSNNELSAKNLQELKEKNAEIAQPQEGKNVEQITQNTRDDRKKNYAYTCFVLSGTFAIGAYLTIDSYPAISACLAAGALVLLLLGCYSLYKASTALNDVKADQTESHIKVT